MPDIWNYMPPFPQTLQIEPTNHCNLNCIMCPRQNMNYPLGFMKLPPFKKIVDEFAGNPDIHVKLFFLGEPLLHPKLEMFLRYAYSKKIRVSINTNGMLLNNKISKMLLKYAQTVTISMEGFTAELYEQIRVGGKFDVVVSNIKRLYELKQELKSPTFLHIVTLMPDNDAEASFYYSMFLSFWKEFPDLRVSPLQLQKSSGTRWLQNGKVIPVKVQDAIERKEACRDGLQSLVVRWDGKVTYCCADVNTTCVLGDAYKDKLTDIWHSKRLEEIHKKIYRMEYDKLPVCKKCTVIYRRDRRIILPPKQLKQIQLWRLNPLQNYIVPP